MRYGKLKSFSDEILSSELPVLNESVLRQLTEFGREKLSDNYYMRDFMYSEILAAHNIPNVPSDPELAIEAGKGLCTNLLEPLRNTFGHIVIRSAFRSVTVNGYGSKHKLNCASNKRNYAKHIWDVRDEEGYMGATACIVIPTFINSDWYEKNRDWRPLAWFIHDNFPYSEMCFFSRDAAFNLTWRECKPRRQIYSYASPKGFLTRRGQDNHTGHHKNDYRDRLGL